MTRVAAEASRGVEPGSRAGRLRDVRVYVPRVAKKLFPRAGDSLDSMLDPDVLGEIGKPNWMPAG